MMTPPELTEPASIAHTTTHDAAPATAPAAPRRRRLPMLLAGVAVLGIAAYGYAEFSGHEAPAIVSPARAASHTGRQADGSFRLSPTETKLLRI